MPELQSTRYETSSRHQSATQKTTHDTAVVATTITSRTQSAHDASQRLTQAVESSRESSRHIQPSRRHSTTLLKKPSVLTSTNQGRRRSYWTRVPITGNSSETEIFTYVEQALYRESRKTTTDMAEKKGQPAEHHQQTRWKLQRIVKQRPGRPEFDEHELVAAPSPGNDDQKY